MSFYFHDPDYAKQAKIRLGYDKYFDLSLLETLDKVLHDVDYMYIDSMLCLNRSSIILLLPYQIVIHGDKPHVRDYRRIYNAPEASKAPSSIPGVEDKIIENYTYIILQLREFQNEKRCLVYSPRPHNSWYMWVWKLKRHMHQRLLLYKHIFKTVQWDDQSRLVNWITVLYILARRSPGYGGEHDDRIILNHEVSGSFHK